MKTRVNGGVLGSPVIPTRLSASGVWTMYDEAQDNFPVNSDFDPYYNNVMIQVGPSTQTTNVLTDASNNQWEEYSLNKIHTTSYSGTVKPTTLAPRKYFSSAFSGDRYYSLQDAPHLSFGLDPFTIEFWMMYTLKDGVIRAIMSKGKPDLTAGWEIKINASYQITFTVRNAVVCTNPAVLNQHEWYHVAVVRSSLGTNGTALYVNGTGTAFTCNDNFCETDNLYLCHDRAWTTTNLFTGNMTDIRISNYAVYTANFTKPTAPITYSDDETLPKDLPGSINFLSGYAPRLIYPKHIGLDISGGTFTIETWLYTNTLPGATTPCRFLSVGDIGAPNSFSLYLKSTGAIGASVSRNVDAIVTRLESGINVIAIKSWYFISVSVYGGNATLYCNGTRVAGPMDITVPTQGTDYDFNTDFPTGASDPYWNETVFLFKGEAANDTNVLTDSRGVTTATAWGSARMRTLDVPNKFGTSSILFPGAGGYTIANNATLQAMGTGDFVFEGWFYFNAHPSTLFTLNYEPANNSVAGLVVDTTNASVLRILGGDAAGTGWAVNASGTCVIPLKTWVHIAVTRTNGIWDGYVNGQWDVGNVKYTTAMRTSTTHYLGYNGYSTTPLYMQGYMRSVRLTKGTARYGGGFGPAVRLSLGSSQKQAPDTALSTRGAYTFSPTYSHSLLGYMADVRITKGQALHHILGSISTESPFNSLDPDWGTTAMLIDADSISGASFTELRGLHNFNVLGAVTIDTNVKKFGTSSLYFPGTVADLLLNTNLQSDYEFGTEDFTIECWFNPKTMPTIVNLIAKGAVDSTLENGSWRLGYGTTGTPAGNKLCFSVRVAGAVVSHYSAPTVITLNAWSHVAVTRTNGVLSMFLNGLKVGSYYQPVNMLTIRPYTVGARRNGANTAYIEAYNGYIDDIRIIKGVSKYVEDFIPPGSFARLAVSVPNPQSLLPVTANTGFLIQNATLAEKTTGLLPDAYAAIPSKLSPYSQARAGYYGTPGSVTFNGMTDYLSCDGDARFTFGAEPFTIECWFRTSKSGVVQVLFDGRPLTTSGMYVYMDVQTANKLRVYINGGDKLISTTSVSQGVWHHAALSKVGTTLYLFLDGVLQSSAADTNTYLSGGAGRPIMGGESYTPGVSQFCGQISNIHIMKGAGKYSSNFTPEVPVVTPYTVLLIGGSQGLKDQSNWNYTIVKTGNPAISPSSPFNTMPNSLLYKHSVKDNTVDGEANYAQQVNWTSVHRVCNSSPFFDADWMQNASGFFYTQDYFNIFEGGEASDAILLLHFNGAAGSSLVEDSSPYKRTLAAPSYHAGAPVLSAGTYKWGGMSFYTTAAAYREASYNSTDFDMGTGDFTIECWYFPEAWPGSDPIKGRLDAATKYGLSVAATTGILHANINGTGYATDMALSGAAWNHIGLMRKGYDFFVLMNGSMRKVFTSTLALSANKFTVSHQCSGYIDEVRVTKGRAAFPINYGLTYTVPIYAYTSTPHNNDSLNIVNSPFTIELWMYLRAWTYSFLARGASADGYEFGINASGFLFIKTRAATYIYSSNIVQRYSWNHIAFVRDENNIGTFYINGKASGSYNFNDDLTPSINVTTVGAGSNGATPMIGYLSNVRISKAALYASDFIPERKLSALPSTSYLALQNVNPATGICVDKGYSGHLNDYTGGTGTQPDQTPGRSPFASHGYSVWFNAADSAIVAQKNANFDFGTGDFAVELYYRSHRTKSDATNEYFFDTSATTTDTGLCMYASFPEGVVKVVTGVAGTVVLQSITPGDFMSWNHVCVQRVNGILYLYLNGKLEMQKPYATTINCPYHVVMGGSHRWGSFSAGFYGELSNVRITKGSGAYLRNGTSPDSFVVPTETLAVTANTVLLTLCGNIIKDYSSPAIANNVDHPLVLGLGGIAQNPHIVQMSPMSGGTFTDGFCVNSSTSNTVISYGPETAQPTEFAFMGNQNIPWALEGWWFGIWSDTAAPTLHGWCGTAWTAANSDTGFGVYCHGTKEGVALQGAVGFQWHVGTTGAYSFATPAKALKMHCWNHIMIQNDPAAAAANRYAIYVNGKRLAVTPHNAAYSHGRHFTTSRMSASYLSGDIRITKGVTRQSNDLTTCPIPTAPWTADANTLYLLQTVNPFSDRAQRISMQSSLGVRVSKKIAKFGGTSLFFPQIEAGRGHASHFDWMTFTNAAYYSGSYLTNARMTDCAIEFWASWSGDFTPDGNGVVNGFIAVLQVGTTNGYWKFNHATWATPIVSNVLVARAPNFDHICVLKKNRVWYFFVNGVSQGSLFMDQQTTYSEDNNVVTQTFKLGTSQAAALSQLWVGYIQDFRYSIGGNRYDVTPDGRLVFKGTNESAVPKRLLPTK